MVTFFLTCLLLTGALLAFFKWGPRPRLNPAWPRVDVPQFEDLYALADWLGKREAAEGNVVDGAEACIQFANPANPAKTPQCFVYIHGFSATWPETAPVTERIANHFGANVLQARLSGHGTEPETMVTPAERWLESMAETWEIATRLGEEVVIVATSTGATLSVWLASFPEVHARLRALLFMSPNFRIRNPFDFLLTAPFSPAWLTSVIGKERSWEPINEAQAKYWSYRYSTLALIEMQKSVDWVRAQDLSTFKTPLAVMYMKNDPTVQPAAAIRAFAEWGSTQKALIEVSIDGDAPDHVFCGDIVGSQRTDWVVYKFREFLAGL